MDYLICAATGYLLGCFNTAYFLAKAKGFDIRETGSRNAGASNAKIRLGWWAGILTGMMDMLKAVLSVVIARTLFPDNELAHYLAGAFAVVGHIFPFYLGFHGGKGYASFLGLMLITDWQLALALMLWCIVITLVTNYIVSSTFTSVIFVPAYYYFIHKPLGIVAVMAVLGLLIIYKHRVNIIRIIKGEEIGFRKRKS